MTTYDKTVTLYFNTAEKNRFRQAAKKRGMSNAEFARFCILNGPTLDTTKAKAVSGSTASRKATVIHVDAKLAESCAGMAKANSMTQALYALWLFENHEHITGHEVPAPPRKKPTKKPTVTATKPKVAVEDRTTSTSPVLESFVGTWSIDELAEFTGRTVQEIVDYAYAEPN